MLRTEDPQRFSLLDADSRIVNIPIRSLDSRQVEAEIGREKMIDGRSF